MCLLHKALYGHPDSGGYWERHLTNAVKKRGGVPIHNHPSSFWFEDRKLLLTVYVDDLLLSGPEDQHAPFWRDLREGGDSIVLEDPEPLGRFLGRSHICSNTGLIESPGLLPPESELPDESGEMPPKTINASDD